MKTTEEEIMVELQKLCIKQAKILYLLDEATADLINASWILGNDKPAWSTFKIFKSIMRTIYANLTSLESIAHNVREKE